MDDHDIFAVLIAYDDQNRASSAFKLPENARWFRGVVGGVAETPTLDSREVTLADDASPNDVQVNSVDRLVVTFSELMKNPTTAIQVGTHPATSHILLGHRGTRGVSARQYQIVVDTQLRIWLHDWYSTHGIAVGYNG